MILGNQVEWAIHCMSILGGMPENLTISAKLLAEFHGVPKEYLSKALQSLAHANLVITTPGPKGGYKLARKPEAITFLEIVEAVEGKQSSFNCQEIRQNNPCTVKTKKTKSPVCAVASVMYQADNAWREVLRKKTLADLLIDVQKQVPQDILTQSQEWFIEKL